MIHDWFKLVPTVFHCIHSPLNFGNWYWGNLKVVEAWLFGRAVMIELLLDFALMIIETLAGNSCKLPWKVDASVFPLRMSAVSVSKSIFSSRFLTLSILLQKQPSGGVLWKKCSENMRLIYRRTPIPKWHGCFSVNLRHIFRTPFYQSTSKGLLL